jgi:hypothetical protein
VKLARWIFLIASIYGFLILAPGFFLERQTGSVEAITHPEFYYGFYGSALVWQLVFLAISQNPARYGMLMPICVLEKFAFFSACVVLYLDGRLEIGGAFIAGLVDGMWMFLFFFAWRASKPPSKTEA